MRRSTQLRKRVKAVRKLSAEHRADRKYFRSIQRVRSRSDLKKYRAHTHIRGIFYDTVYFSAQIGNAAAVARRIVDGIRARDPQRAYRTAEKRNAVIGSCPHRQRSASLGRHCGAVCIALSRHRRYSRCRITARCDVAVRHSAASRAASADKSRKYSAEQRDRYHQREQSALYTVSASVSVYHIRKPSFLQPDFFVFPKISSKSG